MADTGAVADPLSLLIQDMHLRLFQRDVQPDILAHGGSPRMPLPYQLQVLPDLGTGESRCPLTHSFAWRECGCCSGGARAITPCRVIRDRQIQAEFEIVFFRNLFSLDDDIGLDIEAVREALAEGTGILTMEAPWKTASIVSPFAGGR
jgi:hypothetical protein